MRPYVTIQRALFLPLLALVLATALAALGLHGGSALASGATVSVTTTPVPSEQSDCGEGNPGVKFEVTVSGLEEGKKWKDLHIFPAHKQKFPEPITVQGSVGVSSSGTPPADQNWKVKAESGGVHIYADGAAGFGNGTYTFTLCFKDAKGTGWRPITWIATNDGDKYIKADGTDFLDDDGDQPPQSAPQTKLAINQDVETLWIGMGQTTPVTIEAALAAQGEDYRVYHSTELDPDETDASGVGIKATSAPVPSSWDLTFNDFEGVINASGSATPLPSVTVPLDPQLANQTFYLVLALLDSSGEPVVWTNALEVTIQ